MNPRPGHGLLNPLVLVAIAVLALNDHWAKARWPGLITGKLSDFAGLMFFPLFLQAGWELLTSIRGSVNASVRVAQVAVIATGLVFCAVKLWEPASLAYEWGLGALRWPLDVAVAWSSALPTPAPRAVSLTRDPTDLVALPALAVSWVLARRRVFDTAAK